MNSDPKQFAIELRMTERTIDNALHKEGSAEYTLLFEQLLTLCAEKNISVDGIAVRNAGRALQRKSPSNTQAHG